MFTQLFAMPGALATLATQSAEDAVRVQRLKEALVCEVHAAALATATVTSGVNGLGRRGVNVEPEAIAAFVPQDPARMATLVRALGHAERALPALVSTVDYSEGLSAGRGAIEAYMHEVAAIGGARAAVVHRTALVETWHQICLLAALAVRELDDHVAPGLAGVYVQNARVLGALLTGASNGLRPCMDGEGRLSLPPLPQQRRWPRRSLLQDCRIVTRTGTYQAFARDISAGGMGLDRTPKLTQGEAVEVELLSGRRLAGIVAWSNGSACGVRFTQPLPAADSLLVV